MLLIEDLQVELAEKIILEHIDLEIQEGETHILFGPNGSGKTSLLMTIMGYPQYRVVNGKISFKPEKTAQNLLLLTHTAPKSPLWQIFTFNFVRALMAPSLSDS